MNTEEEEVTLVAVLNQGLIEFDRILKGSDGAFILKHYCFISKEKIVLFDKSGIYEMFIFTEENECIEKYQFEHKTNTWSIYNSLCKMIKKRRVINN